MLEQLACQAEPHPVPIVAALADAGLVDPEDNQGYDSMSCFVIKGGVDVNGLVLTSVCAFEEDSDLREQRPDLFYRGPGASPGQFLSFGTPWDVATVKAWHGQHVGGPHLSDAVHPSSDPGESASVTCNAQFAG